MISAIRCLEYDWVIIVEFPSVVCIHLNIGAGICAVLIAGAVANGEYICYNFIVRLRSFPRFAETSSHGYCGAARDDSTWPCPIDLNVLYIKNNTICWFSKHFSITC